MLIRKTVVACAAMLMAASMLGACGSGGNAKQAHPILHISSIPDQDPDLLAQRDKAMAAYLQSTLNVTVKYVPVTDYAASVNLFRAGDLDAVFYGGLTGVQARLQVPGAQLLAQRDVDAKFQSVFIANVKTGLKPFTSVSGLAELKGKRLTYGSETSTSGRLMPEFYLAEAGISSESDFKGKPGFSGSHDKTIDLVQSGTYDVGALNIQVWKSRLAAGNVDLKRVKELFVTPTYHDYHWLGGPDLDAKFGAGFSKRLRAAFLALSPKDPTQANILKLYGAKSFIPTTAKSYDEIQSIGTKLGLVTK